MNIAGGKNVSSHSKGTDLELDKLGRLEDNGQLGQRPELCYRCPLQAPESEVREVFPIYFELGSVSSAIYLLHVNVKSLQ